MERSAADNKGDRERLKRALVEFIESWRHLPPEAGKRRLVQSIRPFRSALVARLDWTAPPLPSRCATSRICVLHTQLRSQAFCNRPRCQNPCPACLGTSPAGRTLPSMPPEDVDVLLYIANASITFQQHIVGEGWTVCCGVLFGGNNRSETACNKSQLCRSACRPS
jgi:hypothetical protein